MNNSPKLHHETFDSDCASSGWAVTLYGDGSVAVEYRTRWRGSRTGQRYRSPPGLLDVDTATAEDLKAVAELFNDIDEDLMTREGWHMTSNGYVI